MGIEVEVGNPQQPHCAVVLLLDTSGSMDGANIDEVNRGLASFKEEVITDEVAAKRVDAAVVTFGNEAQVIHEFSSVEEFTPPTLAAAGATPMGAGITTAIDLLERRKQQYKDQGIDYYRPWLFLITDGAPTDMQPGDSVWTSVINRLREGENSGKFTFFAVGVDNADMDLLKQVCAKRPPIKLKAGRWRDLFVWLSKSQQKTSTAKLGDMVKLDDISGWGEVPN